LTGTSSPRDEGLAQDQFYVMMGGAVRRPSMPVSDSRRPHGLRPPPNCSFKAIARDLRNGTGCRTRRDAVRRGGRCRGSQAGSSEHLAGRVGRTSTITAAAIRSRRVVRRATARRRGRRRRLVQVQRERVVADGRTDRAEIARRSSSLAPNGRGRRGPATRPRPSRRERNQVVTGRAAGVMTSRSEHWWVAEPVHPARCRTSPCCIFTQAS